MAPRAESTGEWLIKIKEGQDPPTKTKPLIQEAAKTLREIESNKGCFDPLVVSLGPYHHGKDRLQPMESYKGVSARWFFSHEAGNKSMSTITNEEMETVYRRFVEEATESSLRDLYARKFEGVDSDHFMHMMFLDGCFILHFIHLVVEEPSVKVPYEPSKSSHLNQPLILRDMFLLENQVPYTVLKALMSIMSGSKSSSSQSNEDDPIVKFINKVFLPSLPEYSHTWGILTGTIDCLNELFPRQDSARSSSNSAAKVKDIEEPLHLLDLLRFKLIGKADGPSSFDETGSWHYYFRSIMELKEAGIKVRQGNSRYFKDVEFKKGSIHSHLLLPPLMVDDATKTNLLNLIAYELCPAGLSDRTVTSYICFLDSLIDQAEDVKELRSKGILLNRLGSDEEVAKLFNELANNLMPNYHTYAKVTEGIQAHIKDRFKVCIAQFKHTHFTNPWTILSSIGAILVILLTLLQTIYTIKASNKDIPQH